MNKIVKLFKWRVNLMQKGYDLGWKHGHEAGMDERHKQIVDITSKMIYDINWLKEDPYTRKDIIEAINNHVADKEMVGWEK